jgi:hypothetical protein
MGEWGLFYVPHSLCFANTEGVRFRGSCGDKCLMPPHDPRNLTLVIKLYAHHSNAGHHHF